MNNNLIDFYKKICTMLNLIVDEKGFIFVKVGGVNLPLMINKLQVVLPTDENIAKMAQLSNGVPVKSYELFNLCSETANRDTNLTLSKINTVMELQILGIIYQIGNELLTRMMDNTNEISDVSLMKFSSLLSRFKTTAKVLIDKKTISNWFKVYEKITTEYLNKKYTKLQITRGGKSDGISYNRTGAISFPLGEELFDLEDKTLLDVTLRKSDIHVFKSIFELINGTEENTMNGYNLRSLNKIAPGTHVLLLMYDKMQKLLSPIINAVYEDMSEEDKPKVIMNPLPFDISILSELITSFEQEIRRVPNDVQTVTVKPLMGNNVFANVQSAGTIPESNDTTKPVEGKQNFWERNMQAMSNQNPLNTNPMAGNIQNNINPMGQNNSNPMQFNGLNNNQQQINNINPMNTGFNGNIQNNINPMGQNNSNPMQFNGLNNNQQQVNTGYIKPTLVSSSRPATGNRRVRLK